MIYFSFFSLETLCQAACELLVELFVDEGLLSNGSLKVIFL